MPIAGARILIVHYGEHVCLDDGYRPARMGRLARDLSEAGAQVTRFAPTYSAFSEAQRPTQWSGSLTAEGQVEMIKTRSFESSRGLDRLGFFYEFARGSAQRLRELPSFDLAIVGSPPPGVVAMIRRAGGSHLPILADVRDLWPDALVPSESRTLAGLGALLGKGLASELRLADAVVALSPTMLKRAPKSVRRQVIPIGVDDRAADLSAHWPSADGPSVDGPSADGPSGDGPSADQQSLSAVFVGSFTQLFDFEAMFQGWQDAMGEKGELAVYGRGPSEGVVAAASQRCASISYKGWIDSAEVPGVLAQADVGLAPTRSGQGVTLSNKVLEYAASGLLVLNSLEGEGAQELAERGLGRQVGFSPQDWANAFASVTSDLQAIRAKRASRSATALKTYGQSRIRKVWFSEIERLLATRRAG